MAPCCHHDLVFFPLLYSLLPAPLLVGVMVENVELSWNPANLIQEVLFSARLSCSFEKWSFGLCLEASPLTTRQPAQFADSSYSAGLSFIACSPLYPSTSPLRPPHLFGLSPSLSLSPVQSKLLLSGLPAPGDLGGFSLPLQIHMLQQKQQCQWVRPGCFLGVLHRVCDPSHHLSPPEMPGL